MEKHLKYKNLPVKFGFSLAYGPDMTLAEIAQLPSGRGLNAEVPGRFLEMKKALHALRRKGWGKFNAGEVISANVTRGIAVQNDNIIRDFKREFFRLLNTAGLPVECAMVDLGLDEALHDAAFLAALTRLLRGMAMDLHMANVRVALPFRIPNWNDGFSEFCLALRNQLMLPQLCFSIDIHPHEIAGEAIAPAELLRWLKFDLGAIRFFYEPETGNHLVSKAITPWLDFLATTAFEGQVTFCPRCQSVEILAHEVAAIRELVTEIITSAR